MTLTLSPQMETRVRKVSQRMSWDTDEAMIKMLDQALCQYEYARYELGEEEAKEVLIALQASMADHAAGRSISLEDYEQQIQERRKAHEGLKHD